MFVLLAGWSGHGRAQEISGPLVVWIVTPGNGPALRRAGNATGQLPTEVQSQTAGSFGQLAGSVGQTAGSAGQTAGSFGQTAGSVGQNAGDAGQTAGSFGHTAGATGQNAGDAGQTVGSFGVSTTDLPAAAEAANKINPNGFRPKRTREWEQFVSRVERELPGVEFRFVDVFAGTLHTSMNAAAGTPNAPDVLVGQPLPNGWRTLVSQKGAELVWRPARLPMQEHEIGFSGPRPEAAALSQAHNPEVAREFVAWVYGLDWHALGSAGAVPKAPGNELANVAVRVFNAVLMGGMPGDTDREMAPYSVEVFGAIEMGNFPAGWAENLRFQTEVSSVTTRNGFAVVTLASTLDGPSAFGEAHALEVLRRDDDGHWKVLQITPNLERNQQETARRLLAEAGAKETAVGLTEGTTVLGISQASPPDGESRSGAPELWWDNKGGATLQVVEWQQEFGAGAWSISNLYFVPDANGRLRTVTTARFAASRGKYRWRVWSMGLNGALVLSPWRTFNVL